MRNSIIQMFIVLLLIINTPTFKLTPVKTYTGNIGDNDFLNIIEYLNEIDRNIENNGHMDYIYIGKGADGLYKINRDTFEVQLVTDAFNVYYPFVDGEYVYFYNNDDVQTYYEDSLYRGTAKICRVTLDGQNYETVCNALYYPDLIESFPGIYGDVISLFFVHNNGIYFEISPIKQLIRYDIERKIYEQVLYDFLSYAFANNNFYYIERSNRNNFVYKQDMKSESVEVVLPELKQSEQNQATTERIYIEQIIVVGDDLFYYIRDSGIGILDAAGNNRIIVDTVQKKNEGRVDFFSFDNQFYYAGYNQENQFALFRYDKQKETMVCAAILPWERIPSRIVIIKKLLLYYDGERINSMMLN